MTTDELVALRNATDKILKGLGPIPNEAINWGDLSCTEAAWCQTDSGLSYVRVMIEECSPTCMKLPELVTTQLAELGFPDVRVETQW